MQRKLRKIAANEQEADNPRTIAQKEADAAAQDEEDLNNGGKEDNIMSVLYRACFVAPPRRTVRQLIHDVYTTDEDGERKKTDVQRQRERERAEDAKAAPLGE